MVDGLELRTNDAVGVHVGKRGIFGGTVGKLACAVCPDCGYTETYIESTEKIKRYSAERK